MRGFASIECHSQSAGQLSPTLILPIKISNTVSKMHSNLPPQPPSDTELRATNLVRIIHITLKAL